MSIEIGRDPPALAALSGLAAFRSRFLAQRNAVIGSVIVAIVVAVAILAPLLAPYAPNAQNLADRLQPPGPAHWLGTDELGRDILSRLIFGARVTLGIVALVSVVTAP
ncbi:MAG TPA: D,D-dipeptide ABC transporter permease, partial [Stellaceae bacterium]|nr:D,D-dipeptide ABC transporter permease [Stellaceae bacterium]